MPQKSRGNKIRYLTCQAHYFFQAVIRISKKVLDTFGMGNGIFGTDHRIAENKSLRLEAAAAASGGVCHMLFLPEHAVTGSQMSSGRKSHDDNLVRIDMPLCSVLSKIFDG